MSQLYESMNDVFTSLPVKIYRHHIHEKYFTVPLHWHRSIEVTVTFSGSILFNVSSNNFDSKESDWIIVNSGELHSCRYINETDDFVGVSIIISVPFLEKWIGKHLFYNALPDPAVSEQIRTIAHNVYDMDTSKENTPLLLMSEVYHLLYVLSEYCAKSDVPENTSQSKSDLLKTSEEFTEYIETHYREAISLNTIAEHFKYSASYFSRLFKELYGVNFHSYLNFVRCNHAAQQLSSGRINLTKCAYENGFPNTKSFITTFKTIYGCTPKAYWNEMNP
ncbi:MAG: AraC family transcriptional regulator [Lachnospiraceae bacterium]|nr:AraC family transcriptional regulator [Lachnospiraceae bacterium]